MSVATDMLAAAQLAYANALKGQSVRFDNRQWASHQIDLLRKELQYWQGQVDAETARASGVNSRTPLRFHL